MTQIRQGSSIVELMVVLSVSSTLMMVSTSWIHQSLRLGSTSRIQQEHHHSLMRLARQFRDDVYLASTVALVDDKDIRVTLDDGRTVQYSIGADGILFSVSKGDDTFRQDFFELARGSQCRWDGSQMPDAIALVVIRRTGTQPEVSDPVADVRIRASVGRWATVGFQEEPR